MTNNTKLQECTGCGRRVAWSAQDRCSCGGSWKDVEIEDIKTDTRVVIVIILFLAVIVVSSILMYIYAESQSPTQCSFSEVCGNLTGICKWVEC